MFFNASNFKRDRFLTGQAWKYGSSLQEFIWNKLAMPVQVPKKEQAYPVYLPRDNMRPEEAAGLADDGISAPPLINRSTSEDTFNCKNRHLGAVVTPDEENNWKEFSGIEPYMDATEEITYQFHLYMESIVSALYTTNTNYHAGHFSTPGTLWTNSAADPVGDIDLAIQTVKDATGRMPDMMWMSDRVWRVLRAHEKILELTKYTGPFFPEAGELANAFKIPNVYIGSTAYVNSEEGLAETTTVYWDDDFGVGFQGRRGSNGLGTFNGLATAKMFIYKPFVITKHKTPYNEGKLVAGRWSNALKSIAIDNTTDKKILGGYLLENVI